MNEHILNEATKGVNKKELASELGFDVSYLYRQLNGREKNILEQAEIWTDREIGDKIIQHLCQRQNGFFYKEQEYEGIQDFSIINKVLDGFSDYFKTFSHSLADGEVDIKEGEACREKFNKLKSIIEPFLQAAENGKYRKK